MVSMICHFKMKKCKTKNCKNEANAGYFCNSCKTRKYRKLHPDRAAFYALKSNAKRRGKDFQLSFSDFKAFCIKCNYFKKRGIARDNYHIDRIDETKGYILSNLQILKNHENVTKYLRYQYNKRTRSMDFSLHVARSSSQANSGAPF